MTSIVSVNTDLYVWFSICCSGNFGGCISKDHSGGFSKELTVSSYSLCVNTNLMGYTVSERFLIIGVTLLVNTKGFGEDLIFAGVKFKGVLFREPVGCPLL